MIVVKEESKILVTSIFEVILMITKGTSTH